MLKKVSMLEQEFWCASSANADVKLNQQAEPLHPEAVMVNERQI